MLELVHEQAVKAGAARVERINLIVGELSGYVGGCIQLYFDTLSKGTIAENAQIIFKVVPTTGRCRSCGETFEIKELNWTCPNCQGNSIQLVGGNELFVESIEVE